VALSGAGRVTERCELLPIVALAFGLLVPSVAAAQTRVVSATTTVGSGVSVGGGQGGAVVARSPVFADVAIRGWTDEEPSVLYGGSIRVEVEGRASVAVVPRAELARSVGPLELRPGVALPFFFAPFTMLGAELSLAVAVPITSAIRAGGIVMLDAFFLGSDVPEGATVIMFNGAVGVELVF
jgi:hypothetical protein